MTRPRQRGLPRPRSGRRRPVGRRRGRSRPASGRGGGCSTSTGCHRAESTLRSPASTPPTSRSERQKVASCSASPRSRRSRATTSCSAALAGASGPALAVPVRRQPRSRSGIRRQAPPAGPGGRRSLSGCASAGPRTADDVGRAYAAADVLVLASRAETYGMVVTEALARGVPVDRVERRGGARGPRAAAQREQAGAPGPARRPCGPRWGAARLARRRATCDSDSAGLPGSAGRCCPAGRRRRIGSRAC